MTETSLTVGWKLICVEMELSLHEFMAIQFIHNEQTIVIHFGPQAQTAGRRGCVRGISMTLLIMPKSWEADQRFNTLIADIFMEDIGYKGQSYTWSNNRNGMDRFMERLDREIANQNWSSMMSKCQCANVLMSWWLDQITRRW